MGILGIILLWVLCTAISWLLSCGLVWLITLCFGLEFSWLVATGIWLAIYLIRGAFKSTIKIKMK